MIHTYKGIKPRLHESVFIAEGARLIGDVTLGEQATVWYNAVLRGDLAPVSIGDRSNIQDGCIGHVNTKQPLLVGSDVSVGHAAIIHGCKIGDGSLVGMGAILLNGSEIGEYTLVAAGSLVPENKRFPAYTLLMGSPARVVRELTEDDLKRMKRTSASYVEKGMEYSMERGDMPREI